VQVGTTDGRDEARPSKNALLLSKGYGFMHHASAKAAGDFRLGRHVFADDRFDIRQGFPARPALEAATGQIVGPDG